MLLALWTFLAGACASSKSGQGLEPGTVANPAYRVGPGDKLYIEVQGEKECSGDFEVTAKGTIYLCYLGSLQVAGKSSAEISEQVTKLLAEQYINNPQVSIEVNKFMAKGGWVKDSVRVLGQVTKPGIYPLKEGYTVLDVILEAGGFTEYASPNRTRIVRFEGVEKKEIRVRVKDIMKSGDRTMDTYLRAGDTVVVPEGIL